MPKKANHQKARDQLAKLEPDELRPITIRLSARLLRSIHQWAEQKGMDLTSSIRELLAIGQEAATRPDGGSSAAVRKFVEKWRKPVERALLAGQSPVEPFLAKARLEQALSTESLGQAQVKESLDQELEALPIILAGLDFRSIVQRMREKTDKDEPWINKVWESKKNAANEPLRDLMTALDKMEEQFLARKKVSSVEWPEDQEARIYWLLGDSVMEQLSAASSGDTNVEKVRKLISARYLLPENPLRPWFLAWDV